MVRTEAPYASAVDMPHERIVDAPGQSLICYRPDTSHDVIKDGSTLKDIYFPPLDVGSRDIRKFRYRSRIFIVPALFYQLFRVVSSSHLKHRHET